MKQQTLTLFFKSAIHPKCICKTCALEDGCEKRKLVKLAERRRIMSCADYSKVSCELCKLSEARVKDRKKPLHKPYRHCFMWSTDMFGNACCKKFKRGV